MRRIFIFVLFLCAIQTHVNSQSHAFSTLVSSPVSIKKLHTGNTLLDFQQPYFGKIQVTTTDLRVGDSIVFFLGEKLDGQGQIDRKPGGNIRSNRYVYLKKTEQENPIFIPNTSNLKNTSGNAVRLPLEMGIVLPFRYVEIEGNKSDINTLKIERIAFYYPFSENNSMFNSSDTILNAVWELCKHTIKATSFSGYYIDGDRERIPYEADALINQLSHYAVDTGYGIARNTIEYLMTHPTWPTEWHLQMHQVVYNDYLFTGNIKLIEKYYDLLKLKTLEAFKQPNGLISTTATPQRLTFLDSIHYKTFDAKQGLRDITDWPQKGNNIAGPNYTGESDGFVFCTYNSIINAFHYKSLLIMQRFAEILHKNEDATYFKRKAHQLFDVFNTTFIDKQTGLVKDGDTTNHRSQHANFFALDFGLVKNENKKAVLDFIQSKGMACSVYGSQFLLDALYAADDEENALSLLTSKSERSWYHMIEVGAGMTTEAWDIKFKPNLDWNHAWGAAPANIIAFKLMGIQPTSPAFETVLIHPQTGSLKHATINVPTPKGIIEESIIQDEHQYTYTLKLPKGVRANVVLPKISDRLSNIKIQELKYQPKKTGNTWVLTNVENALHVSIKK